MLGGLKVSRPQIANTYVMTSSIVCWNTLDDKLCEFWYARGRYSRAFSQVSLVYTLVNM